MKTSLLLLLLLASACGGNSDDSSNAAAPAPADTSAPQNEEETAPGPDVNLPVRYSSIEMLNISGYGWDSRYSLRADLNRRPVILTADFVNNGPDEGEIPLPEDNVGSCSFAVTLTEQQADKIEALADKVRTCKAVGSDVQDVGDDLMVLTERDGKTTRANKKRFGYPEDETYVCKGARPYYNYVRQVLKGKVPETCPRDYKWLFDFSAEPF